MAAIFDEILARGIRKGQVPARTQDARDWFRDAAKRERTTPQALLKDAGSKKPRVGAGRMYHFFYDPKTKKTLPYYDKFPLIFMVGFAEGGFYGINLHYLPPKLRATLMDALYTISSDKKYDENTRLRLSYNVLKGASKYKAFKPCFKHYLSKHVRGKFMEIEAVEWDIALFLPTERFEKAGKSKVWADSRAMI